MHREVKIQAVQPVLILVVDVLAMVNDKQIAGPFFYHAILSFCMRRYEKKRAHQMVSPIFFPLHIMISASYKLQEEGDFR